MAEYRAERKQRKGMELGARPAMTAEVPPKSGGYRYPPGLKHNLVFYVYRKFRPFDPISLFRYLAKEYGDIAHYKLGTAHILFVNRPEYIREILVVQNDNFVKERTVRRMKMLLGDGMINSEGQQHRAQRKAAQPAFHRQRIAAYAEVMTAEAASAAGTWGDGEQLDIAREMMALTLRIVSKTLFSAELGGQVEKLTNAINKIMGLYNYLVALPAVEVLVNLRVPGIAAFAPAKRKVDAVVYEMIDSHRRRREATGDLLDMMLRAEEATPELDGTRQAELRDQVITIFLAGYETVANALIWTWYLLSQNPGAERALHEEIDRELAGKTPIMEDLPRLRYAEAVIAESMRLYPPAWAMGRQAKEDFSLGEYRLPAGTTVLISQFVTHRDARHFSEPEKFVPERFLANGRSSFPKFAYFPFGAGARQCIGEAYAWMECVLVLTTMAQKGRFRLAPGQKIEPEALITLRSKFGMRMQLERRNVSVTNVTTGQ